MVDNVVWVMCIVSDFLPICFMKPWKKTVDMWTVTMDSWISPFTTTHFASWILKFSYSMPVWLGLFSFLLLLNQPIFFLGKACLYLIHLPYRELSFFWDQCSSFSFVLFSICMIFFFLLPFFMPSDLMCVSCGQHKDRFFKKILIRQPSH